MDILDRFFSEARQRQRTVVLPEGEDPRVVAAARRLKDEALAEPILIGGADQLEQAARTAGVECGDLRRIDPLTSARFDEYVGAYIDAS